jgi:alpha-1,2-glucosyltransferase
MIFQSISILSLALLLYEFNRNVPSPYMDEIFHIPQLQRFCSDSFDSYDPKLTTPPGLYFISLLYHYIFPCNIAYIRGINAMLLLLTRYILGRLSKGRVDIFFPPAFFFYFLYYTDAASTFFVLAAYWLISIDLYSLSALV